MQSVTDAALSYLSLNDLLTELLNRMTDILDADTAAFLLLDDAGEMLVARAAKGIEEEVEQGVQIPVGKGFAGRIAAERRPVVIEDVDHADILNPILREKGIRSLLGVPLLVEGRVLGVLHVGTLTPRLFTPADAELLQFAGDRAAMAIDRARLFHQRGVVDALQRTIVPGAPAGRPRPAARRALSLGDRARRDRRRLVRRLPARPRRGRAGRRRRDGPRARRGGADGADPHRAARLRARRPPARRRRGAAEPARAVARRAPDDDAGLCPPGPRRRRGRAWSARAICRRCCASRAARPACSTSIATRRSASRRSAATTSASSSSPRAPRS